MTSRAQLCASSAKSFVYFQGQPAPSSSNPPSTTLFLPSFFHRTKKRSRRSSTQQGGIWGGLKVFIQNNHPPSLKTTAPPPPSFPLFSNSHKLKTRARFVFVGGGAAVQQVNFRFGFYGNSCWRCPPPSPLISAPWRWRRKVPFLLTLLQQKKSARNSSKKKLWRCTFSFFFLVLARLL